MRSWRILVLVVLIAAVLLAVPAVQAGGLLDTRGAVEALGPIVIINALVTALVSTLFMRGCDGGA